jgi:hypothetical protein
VYSKYVLKVLETGSVSILKYKRREEILVFVSNVCVGC